MVALSGGQMQRVALARSLVYRPQLLLLDEPLSNLDAKLRLRLRDDLRRIIKQTGVTALYVTHDQAEAVVLGDRIGVMRDGKLLQIGSPDEIYNRPGRSVRRQLHRRLEPARRPRARARAASSAASRPAASASRAWLPAGVKAGDAVKIAVRPENVRLGANGATEPNRFSARVSGQRYQGTQTVYELAMLGGTARGARARHQRALSGRQRRRGRAAAGAVLGLSGGRDRRAGIDRSQPQS